MRRVERVTIADVVQIDHGRNVTSQEFPTFSFMAGLGTFIPPDELALHCGGSLIAEDWILTAKHCAQYPRIELGDQDLMGGDGESYPNQDRDNRFCHPSADIALIRVERPPAGGSTIKPAALATNNDWESQSIVLAGWGNNFSSNLQRAEVHLVDCSSVFPSEVVNNKTFCTIDSMSEALQGDSGGPVLAFDAAGRPILAGVMSTVDSAITPNGRPNRHVRVLEFTTWIRSVMNNTASPSDFNHC